ncbi:MAG: YdcF family protein [Spirulinaceae cyanobacterium SM2_1_0]|nr:YdcF family protein [Spirulinaceae cyanobacterium SM2_1_0]
MVQKLSSRLQLVSVMPVRRRRYRALIWLLPLLATSLWLAHRELRIALAEPHVAFVLGGLEQREHFAAELARRNPELQIWVSSGSPKEYAHTLFDAAGIGEDRFTLDYQAVDTVTNFTRLVDRLEAEDIESVYLVTSANHMPRARLVGEIVFGSRGIVIKPLPVPSAGDREPIEKLIRDGARAFLWLFTGSSGEELTEIAPAEVKAKVLGEPDSR